MSWLGVAGWRVWGPSCTLLCNFLGIYNYFKNKRVKSRESLTHTHTHTLSLSLSKFQGFSNFSPSERMGVGYPDRSRAEIEILFYLKHGNPSFLYNNCLHLIFEKKISSKYLGNTDTLGRHTAHMLRFHIPSGMLTLTRFEKHKHKLLTRIACS